MLVASACTDGGESRVGLMDAGETIDASPTADSSWADVTEDVGPTPSVDAGPPVPVVMCGDQICEPHRPSLVERIVAAGCAIDHQDAEVCGLARPDAGILDASSAAFLPRDAPGVPSASCGAFLESQLEKPSDAGLDAGDAGYPNAQIDVRRTILPDGQPLEIVYVYPGCCTVRGACGVDTRHAIASQMYGQVSYNAGYGCVDPRAYFTAATPSLRAMRCDPESGVIMPPADAGADAGRDAGPSDAGADADAGNS